MRLWYKYNKRAFWTVVLLGFLFDIANLDWVTGFAELIPRAWPVWLAVLVSAIASGALGVLLMALTVWPVCGVLLFASLIGSVWNKVVDEPLNKATGKDRMEGVAHAALGLTVAYWIGYKFYMLWIK